MPITYEIDDSTGVIHETWSGEIQAEELEAHWSAYLADPRVLASRCTLVDLRRATIRFKGEELLHAIERLVQPALGELRWRTAILVEDPLQFGISRQYQAFAELYSEDAIFRDRDQAQAWLLENA